MIELLLWCSVIGLVSAVHQAELESDHLIPDADPGCTSGLAFVGDDLVILRHTVRGEDEVGDVARVSTQTAQQLAGAVVANGSALLTLNDDELLVFVDAPAERRVMRVTGLDKSRFDVGPDLQRTLDSSITANVTGATHNGTHVFVVVGSNVVHVLDPYTLLEISSFRCTYDNKPVGMLSELEWIHGRLWANHGVENEILVIQPDTGVVVAFVNVKRFNQAPEPGCCFCGVPIARGIAYNARLDALYLTGRYWPYIYQIKVKYMELDGQLITVGAAMPVAKAADEIAMIDDDPTHRHVVDSSSSSTSTLTYVVVVSIVIAIVVGIYLYRQRQAQQSAATSHNL
jgi:hypothetical protein